MAETPAATWPRAPEWRKRPPRKPLPTRSRRLCAPECTSPGVPPRPSSSAIRELRAGRMEAGKTRDRAGGTSTSPPSREEAAPQARRVSKARRLFSWRERVAGRAGRQAQRSEEQALQFKDLSIGLIQPAARTFHRHRAFGHHAARRSAEHHYPVAQEQGFINIVRNKNYGFAFRFPEVHQLVLRPH